MKCSHSLLLTLFASTCVYAAPPAYHRADRYKELYLNSPMTDDPPKDDPVEEVNELPDWVLVGVTKYVDSTKVQIMNKKDRSRLVIPSKEAREAGFSVKEVIQDRNYLDKTVVTLQKGKSVGEVRFDPKFLVLKRAAGPATSARTQRPGSTQNRATQTTGRTNNQPPTPPGVRTSNTRTNGNTRTTGSQNNTTRRGAVPQPTSSTTTNNSSTSSTSSKRTRYVPSPKK